MPSATRPLAVAPAWGTDGLASEQYVERTVRPERRNAVTKERIVAGPRPGGVTLVAVIAWINGLLALIAGIIVLTAGGGDAALATVGWVQVIIGVITILVGIGLLRGNNLSRILATIVFVLNLGSAIYVMFAAPGQLWSAIISGLLAIIGLVLLYSARANEFFRG